MVDEHRLAGGYVVQHLAGGGFPRRAAGGGPIGTFAQSGSPVAGTGGQVGFPYGSWPGDVVDLDGNLVPAARSAVAAASIRCCWALWSRLPRMKMPGLGRQVNPPLAAWRTISYTPSPFVLPSIVVPSA
jgi:hypothetical protein